MVAEIDLALEDSRAAGLASLTIKGANGVFSAGADLKGLADALAQEPREGETDPLQEQNRAGGHFFARLAAHPGRHHRRGRRRRLWRRHGARGLRRHRDRDRSRSLLARPKPASDCRPRKSRHT